MIHRNSACISNNSFKLCTRNLWISIQFIYIFLCIEENDIQLKNRSTRWGILIYIYIYIERYNEIGMNCLKTQMTCVIVSPLLWSTSALQLYVVNDSSLKALLSSDEWLLSFNLNKVIYLELMTSRVFWG